MFSILANIIIVFGLFGMLVATWMLVKGAKKAVQFAGVSCDNRKNRKIRPKKPNYFVRWWNHLKSLYEEDMRKQRMLKRSLPEVNSAPTSGVESTEETVLPETTEDAPVSEVVSQEIVVKTIDEEDTEVDLNKVSKVTAEMLKCGMDVNDVVKSTSELLKTSSELFSNENNSEEAVTEATEQAVEVLEPEVLENETKASKKRGKK